MLKFYSTIIFTFQNSSHNIRKDTIKQPCPVSCTSVYISDTSADTLFTSSANSSLVISFISIFSLPLNAPILFYFLLYLLISTHRYAFPQFSRKGFLPIHIARLLNQHLGWNILLSVPRRHHP